MLPDELINFLIDRSTKNMDDSSWKIINRWIDDNWIDNKGNNYFEEKLEIGKNIELVKDIQKVYSRYNQSKTIAYTQVIHGGQYNKTANKNLRNIICVLPLERKYEVSVIQHEIQEKITKKINSDSNKDEIYYFNKCHLFGKKIGGKEAPANSLMASRFMNVGTNEGGMKYIENKLSEAITSSDTIGEIIYEVRPVFLNDERLTRGVFIVVYSMFDQGHSFNSLIWIPNIIENHKIDYHLVDLK